MSEFADHYLRLDDENAAVLALGAAGVSLTPTPDQDIDIVGIVWSEPVLDSNGDIVTAATPLTGWYINLRLRNMDLPTELLPFRQFPTTPYRRFA